MFNLNPIKYQLTIVIPPRRRRLARSAIVELLCAETATAINRMPRMSYVGAPIRSGFRGLAQAFSPVDQLLTVVRRSASGTRPQTAME